MIWNQIPEMDFPIFFDIECAVVLGQTLIKPDRHIAGSIVYQQMNKLVIDHAERILARVGRKRDVIYVFAFLKVSGIVTEVNGLYESMLLKTMTVAGTGVSN